MLLTPDLSALGPGAPGQRGMSCFSPERLGGRVMAEGLQTHPSLFKERKRRFGKTGGKQAGKGRVEWD